MASGKWVGQRWSRNTVISELSVYFQIAFLTFLQNCDWSDAIAKLSRVFGSGFDVYSTKKYEEKDRNQKVQIDCVMTKGVIHKWRHITFNILFLLSSPFLLLRSLSCRHKILDATSSSGPWRHLLIPPGYKLTRFKLIYEFFMVTT